MSKREAGWYWVKMEDVDGWIPWEWIPESKILKARWWNCEEPIEIGPRIPTPDDMKGWQLVPEWPTHEMIVAGKYACGEDGDFISAYEDMLGAAPNWED